MPAPPPPPKPVMLVILDGWGWREEEADNAVRLARTPAFDALWAAGPRAFLRTSGNDVGLPEGQMGNSEVGHLNIGAGRVVMQDLPRIDTAVADGSLAAALVRALAAAGVPVAVHAFTDGRDTAPRAAPEQLRALEEDLAGLPGVRI